MKRLIVLAIVALAFSRIPLKVHADPHGTTHFVVFLTGTNEVPPNGSSVIGQGWVTLDGNVINFAFGNFRYPFYPTSAGICGPARPGKNGPLIVGDLAWGISPPEGLVYGGGWELTRAQIAQLKAGLLYVSIKSVSSPMEKYTARFFRIHRSLRRPILAIAHPNRRNKRPSARNEAACNTEKACLLVSHC